MEEVTIRHYREGDDEALLALLSAAFGRWPSIDIDVPPLEHLRWKLRGHPLAMELHIIAEAEGRPVGLWMIGVHPYKVGGHVLLCRRAAESCVDPAYQNAGVITKMRAETLDLFRQHLDLRLGGQTRSAGLRKLVLSEPFRVLANRVEVLTHNLRGARAGDETDGTLITSVPAFDERIDAFWEEASRPFQFAGVRDHAYLSWRYDRRAGAFTILQAERDGRVLGYAVLRAMRARGNIADLLALPGERNVARALVREALRRFRAEGLDEARTWLPAVHPYRAVLEDEGFIFARARKPPFIAGPLRMPAGGLAFLDDPRAAVHITLGDSDTI